MSESRVRFHETNVLCTMLYESVHKWKQTHPSNAVFSCYELHMKEWLFGVMKIIYLTQKFITRFTRDTTSS